jgi:hypothetical protein
MTPGGHTSADEVRAALGRQGIAVDDDDVAVITKIVETNRGDLERARAAISGAPEVPHGFVPPAPPVERPPDAG